MFELEHQLSLTADNCLRYKLSKRKIFDFDPSTRDENQAENGILSSENKDIQSQMLDHYMPESGTQPMMSDSDSADDEMYPNFNRML